MVRAEPAQALLGRASGRRGGEVARRELGGEEDLAARDAGLADRAPDLLLVAVHLRGIDVPVPELERLPHGVVAGAPIELPGAEAQRRHARSLDLEVFHRALPFAAANLRRNAASPHSLWHRLGRHR
jgi:hypothetical protein